MTKYITEKEAAKLLSLSIQTLRNRRSNCKPPIYYKFGRSVRYSIEDLTQYARDRQIVPSGG